MKNMPICGVCNNEITESYVIATDHYDNSKYNKCFDCISQEEYQFDNPEPDENEMSHEEFEAKYGRPLPGETYGEFYARIYADDFQLPQDTWDGGQVEEY
jgi:hypothetical protein